MKRNGSSKNKGQEELKRITICIPPTVHAMGVRLAREDHRSFSSQVAALIDIERARREKAA